MKRDRPSKIKICNPMKFSEKISKKNPPQTLKKILEFFSGFSRTVMRITAIGMRFEVQPQKPPSRKTLKWIKKLV